MKNNRNIKVGVVQATPALFNLEKSVEITLNWIEKGAKENCDFLLFPESFIPGYPRGLNFDAIIGKRTDKSRNYWLDYHMNSVDVTSDHIKKIGQTIKKAGLFVALGVTEKDSNGGSLYCTLLYFDNKGKLIGKHRKIKPTGLERYIWAEGDGETLVSFDTKIGKIGGLICWENYMPMARMAMFKQGVEVYLAPTADNQDSWQSTLKHIALEGRCFVLGCNQFVRKNDYPKKYLADIKKETEIMSAGGSVIISPNGEILAGPLWNKEGLLTVELDFTILAKHKLDFDVVGHYARNDIFKFQVVGQPDIKMI